MSTDVLSQLQAEYNQLLVQFFSTYSYLTQRHPLQYPNEVAGLPLTKPYLNNLGKKENPVPGPEDSIENIPYPLQIEWDEEKFAEAQRELSEDLILKTKQIQQLIGRLPGIDEDQKQQDEEIRRLLAQLREVEEAKKIKRREAHRSVKQLDAVMSGMRKSVDYSKTNGHTNGG